MKYNVLYKQALLYCSLKKYKKAVDIFNRLIDINQHYLLYYNLGVCYLELNNYKSSIEALKKSILLNRFYENSYINLAYCYYRIKDYKACYRTIKEGIALIGDSQKLKNIENRLYDIMIYGGCDVKY